MRPLDELISEASKLPEDQRLTLAYLLLTAGEPASSEETREAWERTIRTRIARYDRGEGRAVPLQDALAEVDRRLAK